MIELAGITVGRVLREVSVSVGAGEILGLSGPNGSGKSLLLAVCATLVRPASGEVRIAGVDARTSVRAARRVLGWVPDEVGYDPRLTVREDLDLFAAAYELGGGVRAAAVSDALDRWQLVETSAEPLARLSRGIVRRVALARAWLHRPRVLLLDEPAAGLDAPTEAILRRELGLHAEAGGAAIVVSASADRLVDGTTRHAELADGELHALGAVRASRERGRAAPATPSVNAGREAVR